MRTTSWLHLVGVGLALGALGCGSDDEPSDTTGSPGSTAGPSGSGGSGSGGSGSGASGASGSGASGATGGTGTGGSGGSEADASASAEIAGKSGSEATGSAVFTLVGDQVTLVVQVANVAEGTHGFHIHETGDCSADDAMSAGGHWNPEGHDHGMLGTGHLGDIGNIEVAADGTGTLTMMTDLWEIGDGSTTDVVGHAVVLHENEDDQTSTANPGARIGCGVITLDR